MSHPPIAIPAYNRPEALARLLASLATAEYPAANIPLIVAIDAGGARGTAVREVAEETGLSTAFVAVRGVVSERVAPWSAGTLGAHFLLLVCDLLAGDGEAAEQDEGLVAWFDHAAIDALSAAGEIIPSDYAMIREFAAATDCAPHVEVEMRALLVGAGGALSEMVSFERCDGCE